HQWHKTLSVFGIGKDIAKDEWMHYIKELIQYEYLAQSDGQYPVLKLTEKAKNVLYKKENVYLSSSVNIVIAKEPVIYQQHVYEQELFDKLKELRNRIAHEENLPAYIIFSDSTLLDLATYLPLSVNDLLKISGFGVVKLEKYGQSFLKVVQQYCTTQNLETRIHLKQPKRERKQKILTAGEKVNSTFETSLNLYKLGKTINEIVEERKLSKQTIESHLSYFIAEGELSVGELVNEGKQKAIIAAAELHGKTSLKMLKENLPEDVSYGDIRMVLASINKASKI
ncbi:MAG: helix-turn-helix domain-containing protein, partial [Ginsengibacter sp.]